MKPLFRFYLLLSFTVLLLSLLTLYCIKMKPMLLTMSCIISHNPVILTFKFAVLLLLIKPPKTTAEFPLHC